MTNTQTQRITLDPGSGERADGQHFTCPDARNRFFAVGHAPQGGRHEMNGPVYSEPFAFVYGCAAVLTDGPDNPMAKYAETIVRAGDVVEIKGYGLHRVDRDLDGYNLKLTKVADEDETPEPELDLARVTRQIERLRELGQTDSDEYPRLIGRAARLRHLVAVMRRDAAAGAELAQDAGIDRERLADALASADRIEYLPREQAPSATRVTSWWVAGSRERYGEALFISHRTVIRTGSEETRTLVWVNRRPYSVNEQIADVSGLRPYTFADLDAIVAPAGLSPRNAR